MRSSIISTTFLLALSLSVLLVSGDDCGGENTCGSAFSHMSCIGKCCHDDFNAWCCPPNGPWECGPTFQHDAHHCNAPNSCHCQQEPQVIRVVAAGKAKTEAATGIDSKICCSPGTTCGTQIQQSFSSTTTTSWSSSITVGTEITMKESLIVEGLEVKISMSGTWSRGGSKTTAESISGTDHCDRTNRGLTFVRLNCDAVKLTVPVTFTYEQCGTVSTMEGTVQSTQIDQSCECQATQCKSSCDRHTGCVGASAFDSDVDVSNTTALPRALRGYA